MYGPNYYPMMYPMQMPQAPLPPTEDGRKEAIKILKRQIKELKGAETKKKEEKKEEVKKKGWKEWAEIAFWLTLASPFVFAVEYTIVTNMAKTLAKMVNP